MRTLAAGMPVGSTRRKRNETGKLAQRQVAGSPWQAAAGIKAAHFINTGPVPFSPFTDGQHILTVDQGAQTAEKKPLHENAGFA
jgi:hypothetical protein